MQGFSGDVYLYAGVITDKSPNEKDWKYTESPSFNSPDAASKMIRQSTGTYTIDINPRNFFAVPANEKIVKVAIVFRNADGSITGRNADNSIFTTSNYVYDFTGAVKYIRLKNGSNSVVVVGNFDVKRS